MVDAAICIPVFIIALGMMLQIINFIAKEEDAYYKAESTIQTVGLMGSRADLGFTVNDSELDVSIDHLQYYPIAYKLQFPFSGAFFKSKFVVMDMPYRCYIGESPDLYDDEYVYIFPKNEGSEKEGPKYHDKFCRVMKGGATKGLETERVTKSDAQGRGYSQCHWCQELSK